MTERKRILWIDRGYPVGNHWREMQFKIATALQKRYDMDIRFNLDSWVISAVDESFREGRPYQAMISHVLYNSNVDINLPIDEYYKKIHEKSLGILKRIKEAHSSLPLIAYTGADHGEIVDIIFRQQGKMDRIVRKTEEWYADFNSIQKHLNELLGDKFPLGVEEK